MALERFALPPALAMLGSIWIFQVRILRESCAWEREGIKMKIKKNLPQRRRDAEGLTLRLCVSAVNEGIDLGGVYQPHPFLYSLFTKAFACSKLVTFIL